MKFEDIKSQEDFDKFLEAFKTEITEGLVSKNQELLGKLRAAKDKQLPDDVDIKALQEAADELKKLKEGTLEEQGEYKKLYETSKAQHEEELAKRDDALRAANEQMRALIVNDGLSRALSAHNVNPVLLDSAVRLLASEVTVVDEDGKKVAQVGDKSLDSHVQSWLSSDIGKNFALAPANGGGGAGGNGEPGGDTPAETPFKAATWNLTEQAKLAKSDPDQYAKLHEKYPSRDAGGNAQAGS